MSRVSPKTRCLGGAGGTSYLDAIDDLLKGIGHTTPNDHFIHFIEKVFNELNLILHLGAAQNGQKWSLGCLQGLPRAEHQRVSTAADDFRPS